jgi:hypothetical protein
MDSHLNLKPASGAGADCFSTGMSGASACQVSGGSWSLRRGQAGISSISACALNHRESVRFAALLLFCDPVPDDCYRLVDLSPAKWRGLKRWLDLSGLALYFLDRVAELKLCELLPSDVFTQLHLNLIDNSERTRHMIAESSEIQRGFQRNGISYAVLKGISLWPNAASRPELRSQFDLDYLVAEKDVPSARAILERQGYRMYAERGRTSEFKKNERPGVSLKDIYKHFDSYGVEIHAEIGSSSKSSLFNRVEWRQIDRLMMPVLGQVDLFLGQALHVFRHLRGEYTRASLLLELRRHILTHQDNEKFWGELRSRAALDRRSAIGLATALYLTEHLMGPTVPEPVHDWSVDILAEPIRNWVRRYGHRVVLGDPPGTKLFLMLQHELERLGIEGKRPARNVLLPAQLPRMVIRAHPSEKLAIRIRRYAMQIGVVLSRLRFHTLEGLRYLIEARRWRRFAGEAR